MEIGKFIGWLVTVALILGAMGTLSEVTQSLREKAVSSSQTGMISLGSFNRRLISGR